MNSARSATAIDALANDWLDTLVSLNPSLGVFLGLPDPSTGYGDYSPSGNQALVQAATAAAARLATLTPIDAVDTVTAAELSQTWKSIIESATIGRELRDVNNIASPVQSVRDVFDLMPDTTVSDWEDISERLSRVPAALAGYTTTLRLGITKNTTPARRQISFAAEQAAEWSAPKGFFRSLLTRAASVHNIPAALLKDIDRHSDQAANAYAQLSDFFTTELTPAGTEADGVGREHYTIASHDFLGAKLDLDETYEWGLEELSHIIREQHTVAEEIVSGASLAEAIDHLNNDPSRIIHGTAALREWMQEMSDQAVAELGEKHFTIPPEMRTLECMIAPTQTGGIYYTRPSTDLSRPGRMWWSVAPGVTDFTTWRELTTVYHEGVPGHHLQVAHSMMNSDLNNWRRDGHWVSGHGEGWALYAERLMAELGYLDDPGDRLGMLGEQRMRAARVVLDVGTHLGKKRPDGNGVWDYEYALRFMRANSNMDEEQLRFEVNRYLGWPGQAPSYSVGQRIWEQLRDDYLSSHGGTKTLRDFHSEALSFGSIGIETLRSALSR
ncbi:DUF885 domain-containing protein [Lysinibacter sp. HNR]|uniref:DUF885 domain-containing protein n=1 Tax=Lysinibacter sp. HNR TaxID=3031408 RepID=UPI002434F2A0|nr:DUF885 domain-containing protein [Lysinibacter sp. HNR]WGD36488.1 DUF885 domain-containing protein [Lysinibacter sp. HNR]